MNEAKSNGFQFDSLKTYSTFQAEELLAPLPLPSLKETLDKYLESTKPFVDDQEYEKTRRIVQEFENGIGAKLHEILNEKALKERNWVSMTGKMVCFAFSTHFIRIA